MARPSKKTQKDDKQVKFAKQIAEATLKAHQDAESGELSDEALDRIDIDRASPPSFDLGSGLATVLNHETPQHELDDGQEFDIFTDIGVKLVAQGDMITYLIKKDGSYVTTKPHPYSLEKLQKDFGGGTFRVTARSQRKGQIVKAQTFYVADAPIVEPIEPEVDEEAIQSSKTNELGTLLAVLEKGNERAEIRAQQQSEFQMKMFQTMLQSMATVMGGRQQDGGGNAAIEKLIDRQDRMFEKMFDKLEKANQSQQQKPLDPMSLMKELREAEDRGYKKHEDLIKLAKEEAEERMDMLEEGRSEKEPETLTQTLIKGLIPMMAQALPSVQAAMAAQSAATPQTTQPVLRQPTPEERAQYELQQSQLLERRRVEENRKRAAAASGDAARSPETRDTRREPEKKKTIGSPMGLPSVKREVPSVEIKKVEGTVVEAPVTPKQEEVKVMTNGKTKEKIKEVAIPIMGKALASRGNPTKAAHETLKALSAVGITREILLKEFTEEDLLATAASLNIPEMANPWFKAFYAAVREDEVHEPKH